MTFKTSALAFTAALLLAAPVAAEDKPAAPAKTEKKAEVKDYTILEVGGEKIPYTEVLSVWEELFAQGDGPDFSTFDETIRQNVLRGIVSERLLYKEALKAGVGDRDDVKMRLESLKKQLVIQAYVEDKANALLSDESLKKAYDQYAAEMKNKEEARARHILVDSEEKAKEIAKKLEKGEDFAKLAKDMSIDKTSAARGGDLDYFTEERMVPEFSAAAFKLKKGEVSKPVKSNFGWHIIKLEDRRPVKVQSYEEMLPELKASVRRKGIEQYVEKLLEDADIKYYSPEGKKQKFDIQPPKE